MRYYKKGYTIGKTKDDEEFDRLYEMFKIKEITKNYYFTLFYIRWAFAILLSPIMVISFFAYVGLEAVAELFKFIGSKWFDIIGKSYL